MALRIRVHPERSTLNPENINVRLYKDDGKKYRWQVWEAVGNKEEDIIAASHCSWGTQEECARNAKFILSNDWDVDEDNWEFDF